MSSTLVLPGDEYPLTDADEIEARLAGRIEIILDGGNCGLDPTTVVDLADGAPSVIRVGKGDTSPFR